MSLKFALGTKHFEKKNYLKLFIPSRRLKYYLGKRKYIWAEINNAVNKNRSKVSENLTIRPIKICHQIK